MTREPALSTAVDPMGKPLTKVWLPLHEPELFGGERLWAEYLADNCYRLRSAPFDAEGYVKNDIVRVIQDDPSNTCIEITQESGNGTVQLLFADIATTEIAMVLDQITAAGHECDRASENLIAVTVAPEQSSFNALLDYLNTISSQILSAWRVAKAPRQ